MAASSSSSSQCSIKVREALVVLLFAVMICSPCCEACSCEDQGKHPPHSPKKAHPPPSPISTPIYPPPMIITPPPATPVLPPPTPLTPPSSPVFPAPIVPIPPVSAPSNPSGTCPVDIIKLGVCVPLLQGGLKNPAESDCCALLGILGLDIEVCLCLALDANILGIITIHAKIDVIVTIVTSCGYKVPPKLSCP